MQRAFLVGAVALVAVMAAPSAAETQPTEQRPRIGYLSAASAGADKNRFAAFRQGLQELGYLEGKNIVIEQRYADGQSKRVAQLATELVHLKVDVLVVYGGTPGTLVAKKATSSIPIVFTVVSDPVASGIVTSLAGGADHEFARCGG